MNIRKANKENNNIERIKSQIFVIEEDICRFENYRKSIKDDEDYYDTLQWIDSNLERLHSKLIDTKELYNILASNISNINI